MCWWWWWCYEEEEDDQGELSEEDLSEEERELRQQLKQIFQEVQEPEGDWLLLGRG